MKGKQGLKISHPRVQSVIKSHFLPKSITGFDPFDISSLHLNGEEEIAIPNNLRLGHTVERIVGALIRISSNFHVLHESLQVKEEQQTLGEVDFILINSQSKEWMQLEVAYKFYLLDPSISGDLIRNWIGPNRNDSLSEKLEKLEKRQFRILESPPAKDQLPELSSKVIHQRLCFMTSLYIPMGWEEELPEEFQQAVKGYYLGYNEFMNESHADAQFYLPQKKEWGIGPQHHIDWLKMAEMKKELVLQIQANRSVLVWKKEGATYSDFFVVWW